MFGSHVEDALNNHDLREMAKKRLPKWMFEFVDRGTEDEVALRNNRAAFEKIKLKTQVLVDVSKRDQSVEIFGKTHKMPMGIAPTGPAGMLYYKGELELARAAKAAGMSFEETVGAIQMLSNAGIQADMAGLLAGTGILILIRHGASLGGIGVLAIYLQKTRGWRAGTVQMGADVLILLGGLVVLSPLQLLLSVLGAVAVNLVIGVNHRTDRYFGV